MSSFFGKLKSSTGPTSPSIGSPSSKKDPHALAQTPLEKLLAGAGPIRNDGSDKFFGMENFGNTCYCNSILQCLYYSAPFRENILSYPTRSTPEALKAAALTAIPRPNLNAHALNGAPKKPVVTPINRNASTAPAPSKADDKDSPEYKKKQALIAGPILNMSYQNAASYDMPESLYTSLKDIFEAAVLNASRTGIISPSKLLEVLRKENEMFRSAMHQDAHEFLNLLLNAVVEEIEKHERRIEAENEQDKSQSPPNGTVVKSESATISFPSLLPLSNNHQPRTGWLHGLFEGTLTSETRCLTCENTSQRDEPFLDLSVDLEQHSSVTSCLRRFSEEEMLCERNKFHCDNCGGLQEAEKRMKIKRLPRILALHLKRFKYTEDLQRLQKLFHKVVYPYHLRLFNTTDDAEDPDRLYELYAVVVHIGGGPYHGHYVAIIKTQDRGWLLFDDEMVEPVDRSFVKNFFGDRPGLACAYVLFYQETTFEAMQRDQKMEGRRVPQDVPIGLGLRTKESTELARFQTTVNPPLSPTSPFRFSNLDHAVTAPPVPPNGHIEPPKSPTIVPVLTAPSSPTVQSKKEKAKEEKDRKTAEKEREKAEKERDKEKERAEKQRRREAESKPKELVKVEEEKKPFGDVTNNQPSQSNGTNLSGLDRFRRSKSLKFGSLSRKDKPAGLSEDTSAPAPIPVPPPGVAAATAALSAASSTPSATDLASPAPEKDKDKEKKNRFSIRKKSFGMLS